MESRSFGQTAQILACLLLIYGCAGGARDDASDSGSVASGDTSFAAMQARGQEVMGVDQYASTHHFTDLPDGGTIVLLSDEGDSTDVAAIRAHLRDIAGAFGRGDFTSPGMVHHETVPGTDVMKAKASEIRYEYAERERGGEVRIRTRDPEALTAIRAFLAYQRDAHHAHMPDP